MISEISPTLYFFLWQSFLAIKLLVPPILDVSVHYNICTIQWSLLSIWCHYLLTEPLPNLTRLWQNVHSYRAATRGSELDLMSMQGSRWLTSKTCTGIKPPSLFVCLCCNGVTQIPDNKWSYVPCGVKLAMIFQISIIGKAETLSVLHPAVHFQSLENMWTATHCPFYWCMRVYWCYIFSGAAVQLHNKEENILISAILWTVMFHVKIHKEMMWQDNTIFGAIWV